MKAEGACLWGGGEDMRAEQMYREGWAQGMENDICIKMPSALYTFKIN